MRSDCPKRSALANYVICRNRSSYRSSFVGPVGNNRDSAFMVVAAFLNERVARCVSVSEDPTTVDHFQFMTLRKDYSNN